MAAKDYDLTQPMADLIDIAVRKFGAVEFQKVAVGDSTLQVLQIKHMQKYIDKLMDKTRSGKSVTLPLWAKIWPGSFVMGHSLSSFPLEIDAKILEIGAGATLTALVLAKRDYDVTVVDMDPDALLFSRINALKNGIGDNLKTVRTNFKDALGTRFDCVVGCDFLYGQAEFDCLAAFLDAHLVEDEAGEVFFSLELKRVAQNFFMQSSKRFNIARSTATFKDQDSGEEKPVNLFRFKRK